MLSATDKSASNVVAVFLHDKSPSLSLNRDYLRVHVYFLLTLFSYQVKKKILFAQLRKLNILFLSHCQASSFISILDGPFSFDIWYIIKRAFKSLWRKLWVLIGKMWQVFPHVTLELIYMSIVWLIKCLKLWSEVGSVLILIHVHM